MESQSNPQTYQNACDDSDKPSLDAGSQLFAESCQFSPKLVQQLFFVLNALMTSVSSNVLSAQMGGQGTKAELYRIVADQLQSLIRNESDWIANLANAAALIFQSLPDLNWAGFYLLKDGELVVGPFQGEVACVRIQIGKGVCGTAAETRKTVIVPDVHEFPGHIACDSASRSEIVVPVIRENELIGVLDLDSPSLGRFDDEDAAGLEAVAKLLAEKNAGD
jgi:GAF domain-containing protein